MAASEASAAVRGTNRQIMDTPEAKRAMSKVGNLGRVCEELMHSAKKAPVAKIKKKQVSANGETIKTLKHGVSVNIAGQLTRCSTMYSR